MDERELSIADPLLVAAASFRIDQVTAEVTTALGDASIPSILVKGPAIANWLYDSQDPRFYNDSDLLLRKRDWERALALMVELGFRDDLGPLEHPRMESGAGYPWFRDSDEANVDLHYTLFGIGVDPEELWHALAEDVTSENIGGTRVSLPSHPARLLHVGLHAVQHGGEKQAKPMKDLTHALERADAATWKEALTLAERLGAAGTFAAGLRVLPEGAALAEQIGATEDAAAQATLRLQSVPMAEGFQELSEAPGLRAKAKIVWSELFPNAEFMRWWSPMARRGGLGLALAYLGRPLWLLAHAPKGLLTWWRSRRRSG